MADRTEQLQTVLDGIGPLDETAMKAAQARWNSVAKPLHSLGKLEDHLIRIAGISGKAEAEIDRKALLVFCADNGVVEEGVTQTGQEVTAIVAENFLTGDTSAAIMCKAAGVDLFPVDVGMAVDTKVPDYKVAYGTRNMVKEPAMTREQALQAILTGVELVRLRKMEGYQILATGEMGIGNTTTSSAVVSVLLDCDPCQVTGRGAGLSKEGLNRKQEVITQAIRLHRPDRRDVVDVLAKVGGFDLAGLTGVYLGAAYYRIPAVIDGFISAAAALAAAVLCPPAREYMLASHVSREPGMRRILEALKLEPSLTCDMCLGEGTGAVAFLPVLSLAAEVYRKMSTFAEIHVEEYEELGE